MTGSLVALVPMKGHSERVQGKNVRPFLGKALCLWILETLSGCGRLQEILVDTDDQEIAEKVSAVRKVRVVRRPGEICGDLVPMNRIIAHDLTQTNASHFLQTHSTNPLLTRQSVERAITAYENGLPQNDSLFSVTRMQSRFYWKDGKPVNHDPRELIRTQDLPPLLEENSCLYLFNRESFEKSGHRIGARPQMFELSKEEAVDIDEEHDFRIAEALMAQRKQRSIS